MTERPRVWQLTVVLGVLLVALSAAACGDKAEQADPTAPSPLAASTRSASGAPILTQGAGLPTPAGFAYLPMEDELPIQAVGDEASLAWQGARLRIALIETGELPDDSKVPAGARGFRTAIRITNDGSSNLILPLADLFRGMNSSGKRLDEGGAVTLMGPATASVDAGSSVVVDLEWYTDYSGRNASIWLTFDLPIEDGGYIPLNGHGLVFAFHLSELDYPLGTPTPCAMAATFVDETIPDDTTFAPGAHFVKTWVIRNNGTCNWVEGSTWDHVAGENMGIERPIPLLGEMPAPGELLTVTVPMTAPLAPGTYRGDWRLCAPSGDLYARSFYVQIVVVTSGQ